MSVGNSTNRSNFNTFEIDFSKVSIGGGGQSPSPRQDSKSTKRSDSINPYKSMQYHIRTSYDSKLGCPDMQGQDNINIKDEGWYLSSKEGQRNRHLLPPNGLQ